MTSGTSACKSAGASTHSSVIAGQSGPISVATVLMSAAASAPPVESTSHVQHQHSQQLWQPGFVHEVLCSSQSTRILFTHVIMQATQAHISGLPGATWSLYLAMYPGRASCLMPQW